MTEKETVDGHVVQYMTWDCPNEECQLENSTLEVPKRGGIYDQCPNCNTEVFIIPEY